MTDINSVIKDVKKKVGRDIVQLYRDIEYEPIATIPTGSLSLDYAIGANVKMLGIPLGRITILWGPKGAGKSTLAYHIISNAQKMGISAAMVDTEFSFDELYARACGVNTDDLVWIKTFDKSSGEQFPAEAIWEAIEGLTRAGAVNLIVVDSIDNLIPARELDGEFGESNMGVVAKQNAQAMRKLMGLFKMNNVAFVGIAQRRYNLGYTTGNPETMGGGEALKHASSLRIDLRPAQEVKSGDEPISRGTSFRVIWNKISPPGRKGTFDIIYGHGVDRWGELLSFAEEFGIIKRRASYYYIDDQVIQGKNSACQYLIDNPEKVETIINSIHGMNHEINTTTSSDNQSAIGSDAKVLQNS